MRTLFSRGSLFIVINVVIFAALVMFMRVWENCYDFKPWNNNSILLSMPKDERFDLILFGTSHSKVFSFEKNYRAIQKILGIRVHNLSQGAAGIIPERIYLESFYDAGNSAQTMVYFIDPWVFYSRSWNEENYFANSEPLNFSFASKLIKNKINFSVILSYFKQNFEIPFIFKRPGVFGELDNKSLAGIDPNAVAKRLKNLYPDGTDSEQFKTYFEAFKKMLELARQNGVKRFVLILPPTLLGEMPGTNELKEALKKDLPVMVERYDYSSIVKDPSLFNNHDHLNIAGVKYFIETDLKPLFTDSKKIVPPKR